MNKRGLGIGMFEVKMLIFVLIFAVGYWFINSSLKALVIDKFALTETHTLLIGAGLLFLGLFLVRFRPMQFMR